MATHDDGHGGLLVGGAVHAIDRTGAPAVPVVRSGAARRLLRPGRPGGCAPRATRIPRRKGAAPPRVDGNGMNALRVAVAGWLLSVAGMKRVLAAAALGVLVAVAGPAAAQPGVDFSTTTSPSERLELRSDRKDAPRRGRLRWRAARGVPQAGVHRPDPQERDQRIRTLRVDRARDAGGWPTGRRRRGERLGVVRPHVHVGWATAAPVVRAGSPLNRGSHDLSTPMRTAADGGARHPATPGGSRAGDGAHPDGHALSPILDPLADDRLRSVASRSGSDGRRGAARPRTRCQVTAAG
jgi:hypothetical protein